MLFNSLAYGIFLPIVFTIYWLIPNKYRWVLLLISSYYFYMSWNPKYIVLIFGTTLVSYTAGRLMEKCDSQKNKKAVLVTALVICLGVLGVFKYFNFFTDTFVAAMQKFAIQLHPVTLKLVLPVGISFYTFQTIGYMVDVYRGKVKAEKNLGIYATFISFFPQLVAGPIERTSNLLPQITKEKRFNYDDASYGLKLMAWGFFKKLVLADGLAVFVDAAYREMERATGLDWLVVFLFFQIQVYCDFSGYSDIAIGTAKLFDIKLMKNFNSPFFSTSVREMWARWHISLGTWFRDYVYIPLGGSRCSKKRRDFNLIVTFLLSGLWHGAKWNCVIWGGLNGLVQVLEERIFGKERAKGKFARFISWLGVMIYWGPSAVLMRTDTFADTIYVFKKFFLYDLRHPSQFKQTAIDIHKPDGIYCFFFIAVLMIFDYFSMKFDVIEWISKKKVYIRWAIYVVFIWAILAFMQPVKTTEFVYFQF